MQRNHHLNADFIRRALLRNNQVKIQISGNCMSPILEDGSSILIEKCDHVVVGDVVVIEDKSSRLLAHRVVQIDEDWVVTAGDNNKMTDKPLHVERIVGKVNWNMQSLTQPVANGQQHTIATNLERPKIITEERKINQAHYSIFVNPYCIPQSEIKNLQQYNNLTLLKQPLEMIRHLQESKIITVFVHHGANMHISTLINENQIMSCAFFIGYNDDNDHFNGSHTDYCVRLEQKYWLRRNFIREVSYIAGITAECS